MDVSDPLRTKSTGQPHAADARPLSVADAGGRELNRGAWIFGGLAVSGSIADLVSKQLIFSWRGLPGQRDVWWLVDGILGIETAVNPGAVFGIGAGKGLVFAAFSVVAAAGILTWLFWFQAARSRWLSVALGLITGGILGNLYDRLGFWWQPHWPVEWKSGVRDWILFQIEGVPLLDPWPNFNIADSLLVVGACMLLIQSLFLDGKHDPTATSLSPRGGDSP
jgi:signal peptidase II